MTDNLAELFVRAKQLLDAMTPQEQEALLAEQRTSYARSIANWPKPKYRWIDGVKVYDSYEDYCDD
jgi:hypothetical protein